MHRRLLREGDTMSRRTHALAAPQTGIALLALLLAAPIAAEEEAAQPTPLPWVGGGGTAPIGDDLAEIDLSDEYVFLDGDGTKRLLEMTGNPESGLEMATVAPKSPDA